MKNEITFSLLLLSPILLLLAALYGLYLSHYFLYLLPAAIAITTIIYVALFYLHQTKQINHYYINNSLTLIVVENTEENDAFAPIGRGYRI